MSKKTGFEMQREFHEAFGHPMMDKPSFPSDGRRNETEEGSSNYDVAWYRARLAHEYEASLSAMAKVFYKLAKDGNDRRSLRIALLLEEVAEYLGGEMESDLEAVFDALVDICVIVEGTALEYGLPFDEGRAEVHRANMSKLGPDGKPIHDGSGKIRKGPFYSPPDLKALLRKSAG